ncbi:unnamed protein product [Dibothriocephalus latus]|uniref:Uncharacterized protein n=1 Tax=Dibothriocephalus latus TaxID=60516 RepID=A0A3P6R9G8_DIBLA|nr:unnamed protein product [Dibothriocephalus latus]
MECKAEPYSGGPGDFLDIPAAEQEITVGSNEPATTNVNNSIVQNVVSMPSENVFQQVSHPVVRMAAPGAVRAPRVIMVQRTGQPMGSATPGAPGGQGIRVSSTLSPYRCPLFYFNAKYLLLPINFCLVVTDSGLPCGTDVNVDAYACIHEAEPYQLLAY